MVLHVVLHLVLCGGGGCWCTAWRAGKVTPALKCNASPVRVEEEVVEGVGKELGVIGSPRLVEPTSTEEPGAGPGRSVTR